MGRNKFLFVSLVTLCLGWGFFASASDGAQVRYWKDCSFELRAENWTYDGHSTQSYDLEFADLSSGDEDSSTLFHDLIAKRQAQGERVNVIDLFGSGLFVNNADSMTGQRYAQLADRFFGTLTPVPPQVYGDILSDSTWKAVDRSLVDRNLTGFDLIVMRPLGGWEALKRSSNRDDWGMLSEIIRQVVPRAHPKAEFYFSVPGMRLTLTENRKLLSKFLEREFSDRGWTVRCLRSRHYSFWSRFRRASDKRNREYSRTSLTCVATAP